MGLLVKRFGGLGTGTIIQYRVNVSRIHILYGTWDLLVSLFLSPLSFVVMGDTFLYSVVFTWFL